MVLTAGTGLLGGALAGCSQMSGSTPTARSSIIGTSFDGPDLVVSLRDGHGVSQLNLIGPDGDLFGEADVAAGVTTARLQLLRIEPGSGMKHYAPGLHTLVAIGDAAEESVPIELRPSLRIVNVEQYRDGTTPADLARLALTIENTGSGPTWIYEITYEEAPNSYANNILGTDSGITQISIPEEIDDLILTPGDSGVFVGNSYPVVFSTNDAPYCQGEEEFTLIVGIGSGEPIVNDIHSTIGGEALPAGFNGEYTCTLVEVEMPDGGSGG